MKRPVHFLEVFPVDVGVYFRGGDVGMAEEFLENADVRAAFEKVGGEGVTEGVGAGVLGNARQNDILMENLPRIPCG